MYEWYDDLVRMYKRVDRMDMRKDKIVWKVLERDYLTVMMYMRVDRVDTRRDKVVWKVLDKDY